jgi:tetratricopeptide (TPR) repeat protein
MSGVMTDSATPPAKPLLPDYSEARAAYTRGDYLTAARIVSAHLKAGATGVEVKTDLALSMEKLGKLDLAEGLLREAITTGKAGARSARALARILGDTGRPEAALDILMQLRKAGVDETYLAHPLYDLVADQGDLVRAEAIADRAIAAGTKDPGARFDRGRFRLKQGKYAQGFEDYEARWDVRPYTRRHTDVPAWDGTRLGRKTLLIHDEQGFGDTLQFLRFIPLIKPKFAGRIVLEVRENLLAFARSIKGIDQIIVRDGDRGTVDAQIPIMSLPYRLGTTLETLPSACPYITVPGKAFKLPQARSGSFNVGLVWAGKPTNQNDRNRSMRFADLVPLLDSPGTTFYSLQNGVAAAERLAHPRGASVIDLEPMTGPFTDAARAMQALDLIVTVDTGYAHLAGALGRATIVMLGHRTDWRWLDKRSDSPWYPSMTLVRQTERGQWSGAVAQTANMISALTQDLRKTA